MDALVARKFLVDGKATSLSDLGYRDVGLDDNWQKCGDIFSKLKYHDKQGNPIVNTELFPDLKAMTNKAHKLGLKAGWYANNCICKEDSASDDRFYEGDVKALVKYGFDSIKLDGCGSQKDVPLWNELLQKSVPSGIVIENCHWGYIPPATPNATWYILSIHDV